MLMGSLHLAPLSILVTPETCIVQVAKYKVHLMEDGWIGQNAPLPLHTRDP